MAASIVTMPPDRAYADAPIWVTLSTNLADGMTYGYFQLDFTAGPVLGDTLLLRWPTGEVTYTVEIPAGAEGLSFPPYAAQPVNEYVDLVADFLRQREDVTDAFTIWRDPAADRIRLIHEVNEDFVLALGDSLNGITVTKVDGVQNTDHPNLRALVQVWSDTGSFNTDQLLSVQHSPYGADGKTYVDISPAFTALKPHLPNRTNINPFPAPSAIVYGEAVTAAQAYYMRVADKFGSPALAQALIRSARRVAVLGSLSSESTTTLVGSICHSYRRRDKQKFVKPVSPNQPDWVYINFLEDRTDLPITVEVYWSNGDVQEYNPFGSSGADVLAGKTYWFPSGYQQMKLNLLSPPAAGVRIMAYDWHIGGLDDTEGWAYTVRYQVLADTPWEYYLLFSNGSGGCETVWLRGKATTGYEVSGETVRRPRQPGHSAQIGDFEALAMSGRMTWKFNTGWYSDPYYLEHLQQLPLADAWLVDVRNRRFLKVIVESKTLDDVRRDDETIFSLSIGVKAGWLDNNFTL